MVRSESSWVYYNVANKPPTVANSKLPAKTASDDHPIAGTVFAELALLVVVLDVLETLEELVEVAVEDSGARVKDGLPTVFVGDAKALVASAFGMVLKPASCDVAVCVATAWLETDETP